MATILQKRLAREIAANVRRRKPLNKKELIVSAGYSEVTAGASPHVIIEQKGVNEELKQLGFTPENAKRVIANIMGKENAKDEVKLRAADMILNVFGEYAPDKSINMNVDAKDAAALIREGMTKFRNNGSTQP